MIQPFVVSLFLAAVPANAALGEKRRARRRLLLMKDEIEHAATHDPLTGLANRELFRRRLAAMLRSPEPFATVFVDLDRFKEVNDTMGHAAGDQLLRVFSARLLAAAGQACTVARLGGDEFALLAAVAGPALSLGHLCAAVLDAARLPILLEGGAAHVSASVGVAVRCHGAASASELMRRADLALYAAKAAGRDNVVVFSEEIDCAARTRSELGAELGAALASGTGLRLRFDARVDAQGRQTGAAAVVSWTHPTRGVLPAAQILAIAEEAGQAMALGEWMLRGALDFSCAHRRLVAVPVSALQLRHADFVAGTLRALEVARLPGARLELQITEAALLAEPDIVCGKLETLRRAGVRVALREFGRGFASFTAFRRIAVDRVVIDPSFVAGIGIGRDASAIIQAIIQLGHGLGLETAADDVETEGQLAFLRGAGVASFGGALIDAAAARAPAAPATAIA